MVMRAKMISLHQAKSIAINPAVSGPLVATQTFLGENVIGLSVEMQLRTFFCAEHLTVLLVDSPSSPLEGRA